MTSTSADNYFFGQNIATHNISIISGQCESLKSSASTETTGVETPELSMVLEKAAGMRLLLLKYCNWISNVVGFQLYYYFFNCIFSCSSFVIKWILITWSPFDWLWIQRDISGGFCVRIIKIDFGWGKGKFSLKANEIFKNIISWIVQLQNYQGSDRTNFWLWWIF